MKHLTGLLPAPPVYQVIDIRDTITHRAACSVAKWYSTIHTPCHLLMNLVGRKRQIEFSEIMYSLLNRPMLNLLSFIR
jgi:hypothetical protein